MSTWLLVGWRFYEDTCRCVVVDVRCCVKRLGSRRFEKFSTRTSIVHFLEIQYGTHSSR
jgi:hypothetical protein